VATAAIERTADLAEVQARIRSGRVQGHYYMALLGLRTYDALRLHATVRKGLSYSAFEHFQRNTALTAQALAELAEIPMRTLTRRREQGRLDPEESDRLMRLARVFGRALELFEGDADSAREWLATRQRALGGMTPLELARTDIGASEVEDFVGRLEYGIPT
jgi:putative toxin-antitoxin system antitoxin component (TIGR02293 family)